MARVDGVVAGTLRIAGLTLLVGALIWVVFGRVDQGIRRGIPGGYPAPSFTLPILNDGFLAGDSTMVSSSTLEGSVVLLSFWATWCHPCLQEQPSLLGLQREFGGQGLAVVGILHEDQPARALRWLRENGREEFRTLVGTDAFARAVRVGGLPHTLLIGRDGVVKEVFVGYWRERDPYLRDRVREELSPGVTSPGAGRSGKPGAPVAG